MTKRERIEKLLQGQPVDRNPAAFWMHFPIEEKFGTAAAEAHLRLLKDTDTDFIKIMNENVFWDGASTIECLNDIRNFRAYGKKDKIFQDQIELIQRIADRTQGDVPLVTTIHGVIASAFHEIGHPKLYSALGYLFPLFCREKPKKMKDVFRLLSESLIELVDCSIKASADGVFYSVLGAERYYFKDEEFAELVKPYEQAVYDHIRQVTPLNILHISQSNVALERYSSLKPSVVNWTEQRGNYSLLEGRTKYFPNSIVMGGFSNCNGVLLKGTIEEIEAETENLCKKMKGVPYIIGADGSLPTNIHRERIHTVVRTLDTLKNQDSSGKKEDGSA